MYFEWNQNTNCTLIEPYTSVHASQRFQYYFSLLHFVQTLSQSHTMYKIYVFIRIVVVYIELMCGVGYDRWQMLINRLVWKYSIISPDQILFQSSWIDFLFFRKLSLVDIKNFNGAKGQRHKLFKPNIKRFFLFQYYT